MCLALCIPLSFMSLAWVAHMMIEKFISAPTAASVIAALGRLGLPTTEEVRLITDIIKSQGGFDKMPTFAKRRRGTSRAITLGSC